MLYRFATDFDNIQNAMEIMSLEIIPSSTAPNVDQLSQVVTAVGVQATLDFRLDVC